MATTEDTSAIDEKKTENTGTDPDFKGFASNYLFSIIFTIGVVVFIIGGLGLYTTKVAQANILPDNSLLAPYTDIGRSVSAMPIDINIIHDINDIFENIYKLLDDEGTFIMEVGYFYNVFEKKISAIKIDV